MRIILAATIAVVVMVYGSGAAQEAARSTEVFEPSRVDALNTSGKLQVVEFYHPT
jgi:hypothetical protein